MNTQKFSKRHYIAIAETIKNTENSKYEVAKNLAKMFFEDNEKFSFQKFAKACGITL
jgi:hypothetical protein